MAAPKEEEKKRDEDAPDMTDGYKVPDKVGVDDLMAKDKDDEALQKYKAALIGDAKDKIIDAKDERLIFFDELVVNSAGDDKQFVLEPAKCDANSIAFTLKEKAKYVVMIKFRVQKDIVTGLKRFLVVKKKGPCSRCGECDVVHSYRIFAFLYTEFVNEKMDCVQESE